MPYKGKFKPKNIEKYAGNPNNIIYRSLWELKFFRFCDDHPEIIEWASEEFFIPYIDPFDQTKKKMRRYFPDVILKKKKKDSEEIQILVIEIKPKKQMQPPQMDNKYKNGNISKRYLNEIYTYKINEAKWNAAIRFCEERGWKFLILNEKNLGIV
jgi:hypothetical protein